MKSETYSAAALATALGVPRTTLNDWLTRYEDYIDIQFSGKRKVYSERTLEVLKEVAKLRDAGKNAAEIASFLEQNHGVLPEVTSGNTEPVKPAAETVPAEDITGAAAAAVRDDEAPQLPAVKEFERSALELTAFIAELRKEQLKSRKRSNLTALMLLIVIIILIAALGAAVQAVRMQFAERQLEAVRMQKTLEKINSDFTAELKSMENQRKQERIASEKNAAMLKSELSRLQKASANEVKRLSEQLASDRKAMRQELALREKELKNKSDAERKFLLEKMSKDASVAQARLELLKKELAAANQTLQDLNKKLNTPPPPPQPPVAPAVPQVEKTPASSTGVTAK